MNKINNTISNIILYISSIMLFILITLLTLRLTILDIDFFEKKLQENNYYENLYNEIKTEMSYYTNQSGFKDDIIDDIFSVIEVKRDTNIFIKSAYRSQKEKIDSLKIEERFRKKINNYITINNYQVVDEEIDNFVKQMAKIYEQEITLMGYTNGIATKTAKVIKYCEEIILISALVFTTLTIINFKILEKKSISATLYTSSFLILYFITFLKHHIDFNNLLIYSNSLTIVLKDVGRYIGLILFIISIVNILLALILSILKYIINKKSRRHH